MIDASMIWRLSSRRKEKVLGVKYTANYSLSLHFKFFKVVVESTFFFIKNLIEDHRLVCRATSILIRQTSLL